MVRILALPTFLTVAAAAVLWLGLQVPYPWLRALAVVLAMLASAAAARHFLMRQSKVATRLLAAAGRRLAVFGTLMLGLGSASVGIWLAQSRAHAIVQPPRSLAERSPESVGIVGYREVGFLSADGLVLRGWYAPSRNGAVVILIHGLGANRSQLLDDAAIVYGRGYGVLVYDSRACGESEGEVTTLGYREAQDVFGAIDFVVSQPEEKSPRVGLVGHSMGGATAILAAAQDRRVEAVIAQSTYASLEANLESSLQQLTGLPAFPFAPLVVSFGEREAGIEIEQVRPVDAIRFVSPRAILIVHGALDEVVPVSNAYELYAAAREPRELFVLERAGHGGLVWAAPEEYRARILGFLDRYLQAGEGTTPGNREGRDGAFLKGARQGEE